MKKLYRSREDKKIAGICGGIGEIFSVDSTIIRIGLVFLAIITAVLPLVLTYIIGWVIIPKKPQLEEKSNITSGKTSESWSSNFCYKCGESLPNDAAFCPVCGTKIIDTTKT